MNKIFQIKTREEKKGKINRITNDSILNIVYFYFLFFLILNKASVLLYWQMLKVESKNKRKFCKILDYKIKRKENIDQKLLYKCTDLESDLYHYSNLCVHQHLHINRNCILWNNYIYLIYMNVTSFSAHICILDHKAKVMVQFIIIYTFKLVWIEKHLNDVEFVRNGDILHVNVNKDKICSVYEGNSYILCMDKPHSCIDFMWFCLVHFLVSDQSGTSNIRAQSTYWQLLAIENPKTKYRFAIVNEKCF